MYEISICTFMKPELQLTCSICLCLLASTFFTKLAFSFNVCRLSLVEQLFSFSLLVDGDFELMGVM